MNAGTMEGLIGANQNIRMVDVPMKVFREAERKGDITTMKRAGGYVSDFTKRAYEYREMAEEELIKEQKENREKAKEEQREAVLKRRQKAEEAKKKEEEKRKEKQKEYYVELSDEGMEISENINLQGERSIVLDETNIKLYNQEGKPSMMEFGGLSVSV